VTLSVEARARLLASRKQIVTAVLTPETDAWYRQISSSQRIAYDQRHAAWLVFGYADVQQVLLDTDTFSSQRALKPDGSVDEVAGAGILGMDPPRHRKLRSLIAQAFTQKRVAQLEPRIRAIASQLLDRMEAEGDPDIVSGLAFPLPVMVIAELLGVPIEDAPRFRSWAAHAVGEDYELRVQAFAEIAAYFAELIAGRSRNPRQDLMSDLLQATCDGDHLSPAEVIGACLLLLIAGHETTATLIGNALWCFDEHPEAQTDIVATPELLGGAIEEVLRFRPVVHWIPRVVMRPVRFLDQDLEEGDLVLPLFAAANRDPALFPDPERFDIRRSPNRHVGFGYGIHLCLGASLARLEARIALAEIFNRFPTMRRDRSETLQLRPSAFIFSLRRYPVHLHPPG